MAVQLLNRTTRSAAPAENGRAYFERSVAILADLEEADLAVTSLQAEPRGLLRINAPMSLGTLHVGFHGKISRAADPAHPKDEQIDTVQEGFDLTLRNAELASFSLIARRLLSVPRVFCASSEYIKQRGVPRHPRDLKTHDCLTYGFLATGSQWKLIGADGEHSVSVPWRLCANNAEVLKHAVLRGRGHCAAANFHRPCATSNLQGTEAVEIPICSAPASMRAEPSSFGGHRMRYLGV